MVVVRPLVELEHRRAVFEVVARHQPRGLELREHAIHRRETDVLVGLDQSLVDALRRTCDGSAAAENFEDLEARRRDFQSSAVAQVLAFPSQRPPENDAV